MAKEEVTALSIYLVTSAQNLKTANLQIEIDFKQPWNWLYNQNRLNNDDI